MLRLAPPSQYVPPPSAPAGQPRTPGTSGAGGPGKKVRPKRVVDKPWNVLGISWTRWNREYTPWGKQGLTKAQYLKKLGISSYLYEKGKRGERMMAQREREEAEAEAADAASQKPGTGTKRSQSKANQGQEVEDLEDLEEGLQYYLEVDDDDEEDDDDVGSFDRDGAPSPNPDPDADYRPS